MKTRKAAVMLDFSKPFKEQRISGYGADIVSDFSGVPTAFSEVVQFAREGGKTYHLWSVHGHWACGDLSPLLDHLQGNHRNGARIPWNPGL
jgi:hypothetical protein